MLFTQTKWIQIMQSCLLLLEHTKLQILYADVWNLNFYYIFKVNFSKTLKIKITQSVEQ